MTPLLENIDGNTDIVDPDDLIDFALYAKSQSAVVKIDWKACRVLTEQEPVNTRMDQKRSVESSDKRQKFLVDNHE